MSSFCSWYSSATMASTMDVKPKLNLLDNRRSQWPKHLDVKWRRSKGFVI